VYIHTYIHSLALRRAVIADESLTKKAM